MRCPTAANHTDRVSAACVKAQTAACAAGGVQAAYDQVWADALAIGHAQTPAQCAASRHTCPDGNPPWSCCDVAYNWTAYDGDLRAFETAVAPAGAGMDVCVVSASLLYKVRGGTTQADRRVVAARHIMPVGVAHACTGSDRQYLIAAIAQQLGRFLAMVVPDGDKGGAKMTGGETHWDDTLPASSGINVGCMAPLADE